jgi:hypothetical protein
MAPSVFLCCRSRCDLGSGDDRLLGRQKLQNDGRKGALSFLFINVVMESIPFFDRYQEWFLPHHFRMWLFVYAQPTQWPRVMESLCVLVAFILTTFLIGVAGFQARDIKS